MNGTTVFFDFETGGVEPDHPNIQVAAVAVRGWKEVETFEAKIEFDPAACDPEALALNGYNHRAWAGAEDEADVARDLCAFFDRHADTRLLSAKTRRHYNVTRLGGFNIASFDVPRLRAMMDRAKIGFFKACWWRPLDVLQLAFWRYAGDPTAPDDLKLQTIAAHLGIKPAGDAHEALADVRLTIAVAQALWPAHPSATSACSISAPEPVRLMDVKQILDPETRIDGQHPADPPKETADEPPAA